jgi:hypothetical protein
VGAPSSGKSYFLAAMTWRLRELLPGQFGIRFTDMDPSVNQWLSAYEEQLFLQADDQALQTIRKTELQGDLYQRVKLNNTEILLPRPCLFLVQPNAAEAQVRDLRALVLYDNAGEHFQPGADTVGNPGTQHLTAAEAVLFLFDPIQDARFRRLLPRDDPQFKRKDTVHRQDTVLLEMVSRIRRRLGLGSSHRLEKPLLVAVSKADLLASLLPPLPQPLSYREQHHSTYLNIDRLSSLSFLMRHLLLQVVPDIVNAAESMCANVVYVPVSALGHSPIDSQGASGDGSRLAVRPCDVKPSGVELPLLYVLARLGMVGVVQDAADTPEAEVLGRSEHTVLCGLDNGATRIDVPLSLVGRRLQVPGSDRFFLVPKVADAGARIFDT